MLLANTQVCKFTEFTQTGEVRAVMAPLKQPQKFSDQTKKFVKDWIVSLIGPIAENDDDGKYDSKKVKSIEDIRDYIEPWMPSNLASKIIEELFNEVAMDTAKKFVALQLLNFPERTTKLILGITNFSCFLEIFASNSLYHFRIYA